MSATSKLCNSGCDGLYRLLSDGFTGQTMYSSSAGPATFAFIGKRVIARAMPTRDGTDNMIICFLRLILKTSMLRRSNDMKD